MKSKIIFTAAVVAAVALVFSYKKESEFTKSVKKATELSVKEENKIQAIVVKDNVPTAEELETDLLNKTNEEIRLEIAKNDQLAKERNYFARANAQVLPASEMADFIKTIRMNSVLHKILLERQLDEMEREE